MTATDLARTLFDAFAAGTPEDARVVLADDFSGRQNAGPAMSANALLRFSAAVSAVVPDFHYEDIRCVATDSGFVEEHAVCGTLPDGTALRLLACVVGDVRDGKIVQLREYVDSAAAAPLLRALGAG